MPAVPSQVLPVGSAEVRCACVGMALPNRKGTEIVHYSHAHLLPLPLKTLVEALPTSPSPWVRNG